MRSASRRQAQPDKPGVARALGLVMIGSALTPLVGALSGPILSRALGVAGRGQVAAATAPLTFGVTIGTLGLAQALTYQVARERVVDPRALRQLIVRCLVSGVILSAAVLALSGELSDHVGRTQHLMWFATAFLAPALVVVLYRGLASGAQMFRLVAGEQVVSAAFRAAILIFFVSIGGLTTSTAVLSVAAPLVLGGLVYLFAAERMGAITQRVRRSARGDIRAMQAYGNRIWLGSIGGILLTRLDQLIVAPLSDLTQLGLYVTAVNVAEVLLVGVNSLNDVIFATDSAESDDERALTSARLATLALAVVGGAVALIAPIAVPLVFGADFRGAVLPTQMLVAATVVLVPGIVAGAVLTARNQPQLRSLSLILGAITNAIVLVLLVPTFGATGAAWATLAGNVAFASGNIVFASRRAGLRARCLFGLRRSDLALLRSSVTAVLPSAARRRRQEGVASA